MPCDLYTATQTSSIQENDSIALLGLSQQHQVTAAGNLKANCRFLSMKRLNIRSNCLERGGCFRTGVWKKSLEDEKEIPQGWLCLSFLSFAFFFFFFVGPCKMLFLMCHTISVNFEVLCSVWDLLTKIKHNLVLVSC